MKLGRDLQCLVLGRGPQLGPAGMVVKLPGGRRNGLRQLTAFPSRLPGLGQLRVLARSCPAMSTPTSRDQASSSCR